MLFFPCLTFLCIFAHAIAVEVFRFIFAARDVFFVEKEGGKGFAVATRRTQRTVAGGTWTVVWGLWARGAGSAAFAIGVDDLRQRSFDPRHGGVEAREAFLGLHHGQLG
jgi:hypothetical protein